MGTPAQTMKHASEICRPDGSTKAGNRSETSWSSFVQRILREACMATRIHLQVAETAAETEEIVGGTDRLGETLEETQIGGILVIAPGTLVIVAGTGTVAETETGGMTETVAETEGESEV